MEETIKSETKPEVNPPTGGEKKRGKGCLIALLVVIVIVVLIIIGGVIFWKVAGKKMIKKGIEKIPGIIEQGVIKEGEGAGIGNKIKEGLEQMQKETEEAAEKEETLKPAKKWPTDLPDDLPKFEYGRLTDVSTMAISGEGKTWSLEFEDVKTKAADDYLNDLKDKGWTIVMTYSVENSTMTQASKEKWGIQLGADSKNKTASLMVILPE